MTWGPVADRLASTLAKAVQLVALLGLVGPVLDVALGDGLVLEHLHAKRVVRNEEGGRDRPLGESACIRSRL